MSKIINNNSSTKLLPKLVAMSPYEVYTNQIKASLEAIRFTSKGVDYIPPQLGGITGQRQIITEGAVLQLIEFQVD
jgi:hypothetical protein